jgi:hypothetical protein
VSVREAAIAGLYGQLTIALAILDPAPTVLRNETVPQRIQEGGLVVVRDGETTEQTAILSPLRWQIEHRAEVEVIVTGATPADRTAALDTLLAAIGAAIASDRTLGGAVEWSQPGAPSFTDAEFDGAAAARAATVPVTLWFTTTGTPLA